MLTAKEKFQYILRHAIHDIDLVCTAYDLLRDAPKEEIPDLLNQLFIGYEYVSTDGTIQLESKYDKKHLGAFLHCAYPESIDYTVSELLKKDLSEKEFYRKLWGYLSGDYFPNEEVRAAMLFYMVSANKNVPYFKITVSDNFNMNITECHDLLCTSLGNTGMARIDFLLNSEIQERSMNILPSAILDKLSSLKGYKEKYALITYVIMRFSNEKKYLEENIINLKKMIFDDYEEE